MPLAAGAWLGPPERGGGKALSGLPCGDSVAVCKAWQQKGTKASLIYRRTKNAVQLLLGHTKLESTVRYLGIEVDDVLELPEQPGGVTSTPFKRRIASPRARGDPTPDTHLSPSIGPIGEFGCWGGRPPTASIVPE